MIANLLTASRIVLLIPLFVLVGGGPDARWWALAIFLLAGVTDVLDGRIARRLGQATPFGATLDLIADRLLTAVTLIALIAAGILRGWFVLAAIILIGRDLIVASLNEALPGRLTTRGSRLEHAKIAAFFAGASLLIAPAMWRTPAGGQYEAGAALLSLAALLTLVTLASYGRQSLRAFGKG